MNIISPISSSPIPTGDSQSPRSGIINSGLDTSGLGHTVQKTPDLATYIPSPEAMDAPAHQTPLSLRGEGVFPKKPSEPQPPDVSNKTEQQTSWLNLPPLADGGRPAPDDRAVTIDEKLMDAVGCYDLGRVKECLSKGADPNYSEYEEEPDEAVQPTTPLRMVMFRISDCLLKDVHIKEFAKIAKYLLEHGADPKPAIEISEARYGTVAQNSEISADLAKLDDPGEILLWYIDSFLSN